ncbi:hypothetical protein C8T65DRAFT_773106 [Cerioporus squamosus]|nr:hypothetical protein C8T65DRAFT_773106 [Cerioporus squamosus]
MKTLVFPTPPFAAVVGTPGDGPCRNSLPRGSSYLSPRLWSYLGTKGGLADVLEEVTGIDRGVLTHTTSLTSITVARRMSWAARRVTTRKEDEAYSPMGIFGVNMPAIYGEGALAFGRLQEEILKQVPDQTIFVWDTGHSSLDADEHDESRSSLLAASPSAFAHSAGVTAISREELLRRVHTATPPAWYIPTSRGLRTIFPLLSIGAAYSLAVLACVDERDQLLALVLKKCAGDVHSVGTVGWNAVRARYRSMLRSPSWNPLLNIHPSASHLERSSTLVSSVCSGARVAESSFPML